MSDLICRAWSTNYDQWFEGYYVHLTDQKGRESHRIYPGYAESDCGEYYPDWLEVDPATVSRFTGLRDKEGTRIFEGDLCLCDRHINDSFDKTVFEISFDPLRGYYGESNWGNEFDADSFEMCEVIGNIHDSELLEVTPDE